MHAEAVHLQLRAGADHRVRVVGIDTESVDPGVQQTFEPDRSPKRPPIQGRVVGVAVSEDDYDRGREGRQRHGLVSDGEPQNDRPGGDTDGADLLARRDEPAKRPQGRVVIDANQLDERFLSLQLTTLVQLALAALHQNEGSNSFMNSRYRSLASPTASRSSFCVASPAQSPRCPSRVGSSSK